MKFFQSKNSDFPIKHFPSPEGNLMVGAGVEFKGKKYVTHSTLHHKNSALVTFTTKQRIFMGTVLAILLLGLFFQTKLTIILFLGGLNIFYLANLVVDSFLVWKSLNKPPEIVVSDEEIKGLDEKSLPIYSILCPLYHEAKVLPQFLEAINKLDYPKSKLDVLLLLEEDDLETIDAARKMDLLPHIRIVVVPASNPKTKPKACNFGLNFAKGKYLVIFDAEDKPDSDQLKKAILAFGKVSPQTVCLQAKLNYYNSGKNILTRLFTAEYSLWFDITLPGLQSVNTIIPLGGTSNHFVLEKLLELEGWDAFNVTEDCDLGVRLFRNGYKTAIIDSTTLEEATSAKKNWLRQRSRWIKGYMQTYLVQMRNPGKMIADHGWHALVFQLNVGGKIAAVLINPILWATTIAYFLLRQQIGVAIESVYPAPVYYIGIISLVVGNFLYFYNYMIGCAKRNQWWLIKYIYLVPLYWLSISMGAVVALIQLISNPHYWEKTEHGAHLKVAGTKANVVSKQSIFSGPLTAGAILVIASFLGNILNFGYNFFLTRNLDLQAFGMISLIGSFVYLSQVPLGALSRTINHESAFLLGKLSQPAGDFWRRSRRVAIVLGLVVMIVWEASVFGLADFFNSASVLPFLLFSPVWFLSTVFAVDSGFIGGNWNFKTMAVLVLSESIVKLALTTFFVSQGLADFVYGVIPLSMLVSFSIAWIWAHNLAAKENPAMEKFETRKFPVGFFSTSVILRLSTLVFLGLDVVLAEHFLPAKEAGEYAILSLIGKMVYFLGSILTQFIVPVVSREQGEGKDDRWFFHLLLLASIGLNVLSFLGLGVLGFVTVPFIWGAKASGIVGLLPMYVLSMIAFSISTIIVSYHQTKKENGFTLLGLLGSGLLVGMLIFNHQSMEAFVWDFLIAGTINLTAIFLLHISFEAVSNFKNNLWDLADLFKKNLTLPNFEFVGSQRILIFNWRDTKHVWAGGAEVYVQEIAKRFVREGHQVTIFCGNDGKNARYETIDGVRIIRRGGFYFVYFWAVLYYFKFLKGRFDVVIDCENGVPFFTPFFVKEKIYLLIFHVHQEVFRKSLKPPFSWIAQTLEGKLMPIAYRNSQVVTISESSKEGILTHKIAKNAEIIRSGVDLATFVPGKKSPNPMVLYLGRLKQYKSVDIFLKTAKKILEMMPEVKFVIAGDGEEMPKLVELAKKLGISDQVTFVGKVSEEEKVSLLQKAWVFMNPSMFEGWAITTIEANACGTPVVASNVPGLSESVQNPHTGFLVKYGDVDRFADRIMALLANDRFRAETGRYAIEWAHKFDWNKSTVDWLKVLKK